MQPLDPLRFMLTSFAGWMNQQQRDVIDYLQEENRILREQFGDKRLRLTDDQRRRLAAKANKCQGRSKFRPQRRSKNGAVGRKPAVFVGRLERILEAPFRAAQA